MRGKTWETSKRRYGIVHEKNVSIPVSAGFTLDCDVLRPDGPGTFPCLVGFFPFEKELMLQPMMPVGCNSERVAIESGDYNFYVRRGYAMVLCNVRGTGQSDGLFDHSSSPFHLNASASHHPQVELVPPEDDRRGIELRDAQ